MSTDYTVFVDESFYQWFGLPTKESNLCYGALSVPTSRLPGLDRFEASARAYGFQNLPANKRAGRDEREFKYSDFRHLPPVVIDELGRKLAYFLQRNEARIYGYFIPAEGFMNYKLRSDFIDDRNGLKSLPESEYLTRVETIRQEMLKEWEDAEHNLGLLKECYRTFFNFLVQGHGGYLKKSFQVVYDSRNPEEDAALHVDAESFAALADRVTPGVFAHYKGYTTATSASSAGLRIVDWVAGEVRNFFYRNPAVLNSDSSFDILSPYLNPKMMLVEGRAPFYRKKLSPAAIESLTVPGRGFMLPHLRPHFASGFLAHYASKGEARLMAVEALEIFDMAD
jgi:hypothetical protein